MGSIVQMSNDTACRGQLGHSPASNAALPSSQGKVTARGQGNVIAFNVSHILLSVLFLWLLAVHAIGLFFFTKGFLLTRLVLDNKSQCSVLPDGTLSQVQNGCWHPKTFEKAVVVIIDALRYDFTVPFQADEEHKQPGLYHDHLPFMYDVATQTPSNAFLLPFIADPPTTTLQRLKGLTTGNLPTFIDIGSNFAGKAIEEDNLLVQLRSANKSIVHLGDDTWHSLFPGYFDQNLTHAYDSFNVWDLHTVDNGVIEHIIPLLESSKDSKWDVIFAHFLGVDHAGHRYGPDHAAMGEKLAQMDRVLRDIVKRLDDETVLVVMGDHGMDPKGDHGGESDEEVQAAIWMYSKRPTFRRIDPKSAAPPLTAKDRPVEQIDLVSTLSLLLGLPIPFNNLGTPIAEAFAGSSRVDWQNLAAVNLLAFEQIQNYQQEYTRSRDLEVNQMQQRHSDSIRDALKHAGSGRWEEVNLAYGLWHKETIDMYRRLWAKFDLIEMSYGVQILAFGLITLFLLARLPHSDKADSLPRSLRHIGIGAGAGAGIGLGLGQVLPQLETVSTGVMYGAVIGSLIGAAALYTQYQKLLETVTKTSAWGWLGLTFTITQAAGFASNSYTIHEDTILLFFLTSFGAISLMSSLRQTSTSDRILGAYQSALFIVLSRLASFSRLCREEQMPGCRSTFYASSNSSTSAPWQLLIPFAIALLLPEIIKAFYSGTASYAASAGFWIGFSFRMGLLLVAVYWTLDAADNGDWLKDTFSSTTLKTINITVARCALAIALPVGVGTFIWAKPCINITLQEPGAAASGGPTTSRPQITILGYANTFGSRFFLFIPILVLTTILLLPPMGQFSLAICTWQILCLLEILDTNGLTVSSLNNSSIGPIMLAILGSYHFFKTGHQAVLSSIQWNAAFVPLWTIRYPWSPILVVLNSFGAQILCATAVPLTVLWKRPVSNKGLRGVWSDVMNACLTHALYYATIQLATTMWAGHLRRHLMLYRVFMPRFLLASGMLIVIDLILILCAFTAVRVAGLSVGEVFGY